MSWGQPKSAPDYYYYYYILLFLKLPRKNGKLFILNMYLESKFEFRSSFPSNVVCTKNIIIGINSSVSRKQLLQFGFERKEENRQILLALNYLYIFTALLYNAMVYESRFKLI